MKFNKILFATDFSAASQTAFEYASALARDAGARMLIVHVEEPPVSYATGEMLVIHPDVPNPELGKMLEKIVPEGGVPHEHCLVIGTPADEIVRLAEEQRADLIVVGTHGRKGLSRLLTGSVAELVLRRAQCPVLAVKAAGKIAQAAKDNPSRTSVSH
jgi:nucleotide-binding universal stress UspA family protein